MDVVIRAAVIFCFLYLFTRALGKRELTEMSPFELIVLVTLGDMVQQGITQEDYSVTGAILAVGTMGLLSIALSYVGFRSKRAHALLEGPPVVVVRDGRPIEEAMKIERLSLADLFEEARQQGISDLNEVRVGILEPDGKFSFIKDGDS
jgi:uncharacterized membrane protein YcaP (DUF421 family)